MATDLNKFKWIFVTDTGHRFKSFTWLHTEEKILTFNPPSGGGGGEEFSPGKKIQGKREKEKRKKKGKEKGQKREKREEREEKID